MTWTWIDHVDCITIKVDVEVILVVYARMLMMMINWFGVYLHLLCLLNDETK